MCVCVRARARLCVDLSQSPLSFSPKPRVQTSRHSTVTAQSNCCLANSALLFEHFMSSEFILDKQTSLSCVTYCAILARFWLNSKVYRCPTKITNMAQRSQIGTAWRRLSHLHEHYTNLLVEDTGWNDETSIHCRYLQKSRVLNSITIRLFLLRYVGC